MLNDKNTIYYIVNLERDKGRKKNILSQLKHQNIINFKIIEAVDGSQLSKNDLKRSTYQNNKNSFKWHIKLSNSEIGCALSHLKIYKDFINSNYELAVIFEDDIFFKHQFNDEIKSLIYESFSENGQILLLGELKQYFIKDLYKRLHFKIVDTETAYFTHAYVINKKAASAIIDFNYPIKTVADNHLLWKLYLGIQVYGIDPFIIDQNDKFKSNINHEKFHDEIKKIERNIPFYKKQILWRRKFYKLKIKLLKIIFPHLLGSHFKKK